MAVILETEVEQALWLSIYKEQLRKANYPSGSDTARAQLVQCSMFADDSIIEFRARAGKHNHKTIPVQDLTNDVYFQQVYCKDDDN